MASEREQKGTDIDNVKIDFIRYGKSSKSNVVYAYLEGHDDKGEQVKLITYNASAIELVEDFVNASPENASSSYVHIASIKTGNWVSYSLTDIETRLDIKNAVKRDKQDLVVYNFSGYEVSSEYKDELKAAKDAYRTALRKAFGTQPEHTQEDVLDEAVSDMNDTAKEAGKDDSPESETSPDNTSPEIEAPDQESAEEEDSEHTETEDNAPEDETDEESYGGENVSDDEVSTKDVDLETVKEEAPAEKKEEKPEPAKSAVTQAKRPKIKPKIGMSPMRR